MYLFHCESLYMVFWNGNKKKTIIIIGTSRAYSEFYLISVVCINENIPDILFKAQRVKVETTF